MNWPQTVRDLVSPLAPDLDSAFLTMSLSTLAYLDVGLYGPRLKSILGADTVTRVGGGSEFTPHVLVLTGPGATIAAFEGTRNWQQWAQFATGFGWTRWPTGPGKVYAAFYNLFELLRPTLINLLALGGNLFLAGHSLGASMAAFFGRLGQDLGTKPRVVHCFGAPKCVDQWWRDNYRALTWSLDHPNDVIPRTPFDSLLALMDQSVFARARVALVPTGQPWTLPQWAGLQSGLRTIGPVDAWCAAAAAPRLAFHQTFQYLRGLREAMVDNERLYTQPLASLMLDLGLFDPWPA